MATRHLPVADLCGKCSAESKRPPEGTIPPEGLKTELGLLCPTLFIPAVARFR